VINDVWTFTSNGQEHKIKMSGNRASNDGDLVIRWCAAGHGLAVKSCLDVADDLLEKRIISVMPNYQPRTSELWLVCPSRQSITPAIRLLRDMLKQKCAVILQHLVAHEFIDSHSVR